MNSARVPDRVPRLQDVFWGRIPIPLTGATSHFLVAGATGSGKTLLLDCLMYTALHHRELNPAWRFIVYDPKLDAIPKLTDMLRGFEPVILNPLDSRSKVWNIHADIDSPSAAREFASILAPDEPKSENPFFTSAVQDLISGVAVSLSRRIAEGYHWSFRDLLWILFNTGEESGLRDFERLVGGQPETRRLLDYFQVPETAFNIRATIMAKLTRYEPVAAAWHHRARSNPERLFSLKSWTKDRPLGGAQDIDYETLSRHVAVIGIDETSRSAVDAVNRAMFVRLSQLLLSSPDVHQGPGFGSGPLTWVFLDEVREAGNLEGLHRLLNKGRSKGVAAAIGFQDIQGLRDAYGTLRADEMIGQCATIAVLRLRSPETAEWASRLFGDFYVTAESDNESFGSSISIGRGRAIERRRKILDSDLYNLPSTSPKNGLTGYFECPFVPGMDDPAGFDPKLHVSWDDLGWRNAKSALEKGADLDNVMGTGAGPDWRINVYGQKEVPAEEQVMPPFDDYDRKALSLGAEGHIIHKPKTVPRQGSSGNESLPSIPIRDRGKRGHSQ